MDDPELQRTPEPSSPPPYDMDSEPTPPMDEDFGGFSPLREDTAMTGDQSDLGESADNSMEVDDSSEASEQDKIITLLPPKLWILIRAKLNTRDNLSLASVNQHLRAISLNKSGPFEKLRLPQDFGTREVFGRFPRWLKQLKTSSKCVIQKLRVNWSKLTPGGRERVMKLLETVSTLKFIHFEALPHSFQGLPMPHEHQSGPFFTNRGNLLLQFEDTEIHNETPDACRDLEVIMKFVNSFRGLDQLSITGFLHDGAVRIPWSQNQAQIQTLVLKASRYLRISRCWFWSSTVNVSLLSRIASPTSISLINTVSPERGTPFSLAKLRSLKEVTLVSRQWDDVASVTLPYTLDHLHLHGFVVDDPASRMCRIRSLGTGYVMINRPDGSFLRPDRSLLQVMVQEGAIRPRVIIFNNTPADRPQNPHWQFDFVEALIDRHHADRLQYVVLNLLNHTPAIGARIITMLLNETPLQKLVLFECDANMFDQILSRLDPQIYTDLVSKVMLRHEKCAYMRPGSWQYSRFDDSMIVFDMEYDLTTRAFFM